MMGIRARRAQVRRWGAALAAASVLGGTGPAAAEQVVLRTYDGSVSLRGELLGFDGEAYSLRTAIGEMRIDALQVTCEGTGCPPPELLRSVFRISGSNTIGADLMPALIEAYGFTLDAEVLREPTGPNESRFTFTGDGARPLAEVTLASPGSGVAFEDLLANAAAIGMSSRRARNPEVAAIAAAGLGALDSESNEHVLALDGLAIVVAGDNPVRALAVAEIAGIFAGRITNWREVGGPDAPIRLYVSGAIHGTRDTFETLVMRPYNLEIAPTATEFAVHSDVSDAVAADPLGIGFVGLAAVRSARALAIRTECGILATPDPFLIKTEEYPLARRLYLYTADRPMPPHARKLLEFALSDAAQDVIADAGFVDQDITSMTLDAQGLRIANTILLDQGEVSVSEVRAMLADLVSAERLSVTLRFEPGASVLDSRSRVDIRRLGEALAAGRFAGREILLIGFTDAVGRADLNRTLSLRRAEQVREAMLAAVPPGALDGVPIRTLGYGEMSPVGCNETFDGRRTNRRVEVWVRNPQ